MTRGCGGRAWWRLSWSSLFRCHQQPVSRHIITPKLCPLSLDEIKVKIEHSRRARPGYELNCDAELTPIFYFRGGEKIQLTAPCWPRVPTAGVQCPVSGLCHCWGRGQNFPHYRQNYFPNTLISTCPALILLLKSDKSSQMLHCTVQNRSLSWKHPENCWTVTVSVCSRNKQQTVHCPPIQRSVQWRSCSQSRHHSIHGFGNTLCVA